MKKILLFLLAAAFSLTGFSQADASLAAFTFRDASGTTLVNANNLTVGTTYRLRLPIANLYSNPIPTGGTTLVVTLGPYMQFVGTGIVATAEGNQYFSSAVNGAADRITLTQIAEIPANFSGRLWFDVIVTAPTPVDGGTVIANWGVNTPPFTDISSVNNTTSATYKTQAVLPVKFVSLDASNVNCTVNVSWKVADEVNVSHYEVLVSNNGAAFRSVGNANANRSNGGAYSSSFAIPADLKGQVLFVQVKEVDNDGKFTLSNVKTVRGNCDNARQLIVYAYPNPVVSTNYINVAAKEGVFEGKYKLELLDNNGKLYQVKEVELNNAVSVPFEFRSTLSPGKYMIRVSNLDGSQTSTVQFIKVGGVL
jgi:hypothetical protein